MNTKLQPNKQHFSKQHRPSVSGKIKVNSISFGNYILLSKTSGLFTSNHILTLKNILNKSLKNEGRFYLPLFPQNAITSRSSESRMGSGKGNIKYWICIIKLNTIICELLIDSNKINSLVKYINSKLPIKIKLSELQINL